MNYHLFNALYNERPTHNASLTGTAFPICLLSSLSIAIMRMSIFAHFVEETTQSIVVNITHFLSTEVRHDVLVKTVVGVVVRDHADLAPAQLRLFRLHQLQLASFKISG